MKLRVWLITVAVALSASVAHSDDVETFRTNMRNRIDEKTHSNPNLPMLEDLFEIFWDTKGQPISAEQWMKDWKLNFAPEKGRAIYRSYFTILARRVPILRGHEAENENFEELFFGKNLSTAAVQYYLDIEELNQIMGYSTYRATETRKSHHAFASRLLTSIDIDGIPQLAAALEAQPRIYKKLDRVTAMILLEGIQKYTAKQDANWLETQEFQTILAAKINLTTARGNPYLAMFIDCVDALLGPPVQWGSN